MGLADAMHYFAKAPAELIYLPSIALAGGLAVTLYYALPPSHRRYLKLFLLGSIAIALSFGLAVYIATGAWLLSSGGKAALAANYLLPYLGGLLIIAGFAYTFWRDFVRALRGEPLHF